MNDLSEKEHIKINANVYGEKNMFYDYLDDIISKKDGCIVIVPDKNYQLLSETAIKTFFQKHIRLHTDPEIQQKIDNVKNIIGYNIKQD
ncbi:MAG: hypothetical protein K0B02_01865 [DPANN group archaeon]|nr:hypothetical protein [DPANN group archaeon]